MEETLFAVSEYCVVFNIDQRFVDSLEEEGLVIFTSTGQEKFVSEGQLHDLERFTRWHNELGINVAGIDVIRNLVDRVKELQAELQTLRSSSI